MADMASLRSWRIKGEGEGGWEIGRKKRAGGGGLGGRRERLQ